MPESDVMPSGEATPKSPLDKPLHQITEEDISQVTREDCRRFLKGKGMRRPSWNKSQAIQQVLLLKALLEPSPDSDAYASRRLYIPRPTTSNNNNNLARVQQAAVTEPEISDSAEEALWSSGKDLEKPNISGQPPAPPAVAINKSAPPRIVSGSSDILVGQMTIFYCGQVNVYDDVPIDKVQTIMHLAGSPIHIPPGPIHSHPADVEVGQDASLGFLPLTQTVKKSGNCHVQMEESGPFYEDNPVEGSGSRKASVQRYLEKRKDRFKNKKRAVVSSSPNLDIYLKPQMPCHSANENSERTMEGRSN